MKTPAWLLKGLFHSTPGTLELRDDTLSLTLSNGERVFSTSLSTPYTVQFPWYYFGAGLILTLESTHYRISFLQQGEDGDIRTGIQNGKAWRERLKAI
ncbi:MAG: hypothetical protein QM758_17905 [Armatimonas sp.]